MKDKMKKRLFYASLFIATFIISGLTSFCITYYKNYSVLPIQVNENKTLSTENAKNTAKSLKKAPKTVIQENNEDLKSDEVEKHIKQKESLDTDKTKKVAKIKKEKEKKEKKQTVKSSKKPKTSKKHPHKIKVQSILDVDPIFIDLAEEYLDTIYSKYPSVITSFKDNGYKIYVTGEDIASLYFNGQYSRVRGCFVSYDKKILLEDRPEAIPEIRHEIGHYVDFVNGYPSQSEEFLQIYYDEVDSFKSRISNSSAIRNSLEFFAETFAYLIIDENVCTPRARKFVKTILKNF